MKFLNKTGLNTFLRLFNTKLEVSKHKEALAESERLRKQFLEEIDYEKELAFDTTWIVPSNNAPYVGSAIVGATYVA